MKTLSKINAITSLVPNAQVVIRGDNVEWIQPDEAPVNDEQIQAELERLTSLEEVKKANQPHLNYLNSTDWYVVRFAETGREVPEDVLQKRQAARDAIQN